MIFNGVDRWFSDQLTTGDQPNCYIAINDLSALALSALALSISDIFIILPRLLLFDPGFSFNWVPQNLLVLIINFSPPDVQQCGIHKNNFSETCDQLFVYGIIASDDLFHSSSMWLTIWGWCLFVVSGRHSVVSMFYTTLCHSTMAMANVPFTVDDARCYWNGDFSLPCQFTTW